jgi:hypothetical protein
MDAKDQWKSPYFGVHMSTALISFLLVSLVLQVRSEPCQLCNEEYSEHLKVLSCACERSEMCNVTGGTCIDVNGKQLCSGVCTGESTLFRHYLTYSISDEDGGVSISECGHCNPLFPKTEGTPPPCPCSTLETCNLTAGFCQYFVNGSGAQILQCTGQCHLERRILFATF